ncbi:hypothetical protein BGW39_010456 [Mortierella sp. 14UC]|nr:hypothetical protein BGW39_010456 [Mortierella sp. 14UC]
MKFFFLSVSAIMALATAQNAETMVEPAIDTNVADAPLVAVVVPAAADISPAGDDEVEINHGSGRPLSQSTAFTAWSSPGFRGHKLDGGAVGNFEGNSDYQYAFYGDLSCKVNTLFASSTAPVRRIDPIVYPRSVSIFTNRDGDGTPKKPNLNKYTLVTWSRPNFFGDNEKYRGMGCVNLDGSVFMSFQGDHHYTFYLGPYCQGHVTVESSGGMSSHKRMNPRSVMIRKFSCHPSPLLS